MHRSSTRSRLNPAHGYETNGFLTLNARNPKDRPDQVALLTVGSDGLIMIEEGILVNRTSMQLHVQYNKQHPDSVTGPLAYDIGKTRRTYKLTSDDTMEEMLERPTVDGSTQRLTKIFKKVVRITEF